jgi:hypothetical protein
MQQGRRGGMWGKQESVDGAVQTGSGTHTLVQTSRLSYACEKAGCLATTMLCLDAMHSYAEYQQGNWLPFYHHR